MKMFKGIPSSAGIGIGNILVLSNITNEQIPHYSILDNQKDAQWGKFEKALQEVSSQLTKSIDSNNKEQSAIFETYIMMLADTEFINQIKKQFYDSSLNIEYIVNNAVHSLADQLESVNDPYLTERAVDILDVYGRVISQLQGKSSKEQNIPDNAVIVAQNVQPSQAMDILKHNIKGLVLKEGGINSHLAILARSYGIPAVFNIDTTLIGSQLNDEKIIVDGNTGKVIISPSEKELAEYLEKFQEEEIHHKELEKFITLPCKTKDNIEIKIYANIGSVEEAKLALANGADGIGLFRTEFLFMQEKNDNHLLSEEIQFETYKEILLLMKDKPVTIRTLDAGGDKVIAPISAAVEEERNPLLGNRAIRFCLSNKELFKSQLRALFRASVFGNLKIMLPLLTGIEELEEVLLLVKEVKKELQEKNIPFNDVPIGIMVETPSAAILSDYFSTKAQFFSIGTNDLTQYTISVDRENAFVEKLFNEFHLAVLRLIFYTSQNAIKANIPISVCGEMAGRDEGALLLIALGIRALSMTPQHINQIKSLVSQYTLQEITEKHSEILKTIYNK